MEFPKFKKTKLSQLVTHGLIISGRGGSKSSGSSRTPVEADDTVNSRAMASVLDLLGEGVIGGLVDGAKSIFLDETPLQNDDGSYNFSGVTWWFRDGSQDQSVIDGFDYIETPKAVGRQLKKTSQINVSLDSAESDRVRIVMKFPSLRTIDKTTGDTTGATVQFKFQIDAGTGAGFIDAIPDEESEATVTVTAKKTGVYYRSYTIGLPKPGKAYTLRAIRLTDDHTDNSYQYDDTYVDSIGEIVNTSLNYPNSALVGLKVNSEQFGSTMPSRSYLIQGMKIRVPSNYDASNNTYQGNWDGTFQLLSSSNPAWIMFDLLTNTRYGLGDFIDESMINLGELYQIGRYCDATVDDGFGGKEKRFSINTQITSRQDAYRVVQDIAGAFLGMVYWAGGTVHITQDSPSDPVMMFSNSNVVNGAFSYKGSARKDRYSVALITYNNKDDGYKQSVEYVEDQEAIKRYGIRKTESVAYGCTSRGQAHRVGLWLLYTSRMESDLITFTVGMDSVFLMPGDVILIADKYRAGRRNSGRIMAYTSNSIKLDAPVDLTTVGNHITFLSSEGKMIERDILENGSNITTVTFKDALGDGEMPVSDSVWVIAQPDLAPLQARVVSVAEGTDGVSFNVTAIQNNPTKYEAIDNGAELIPQSTTVLDPTFSKPSDLSVTEGTYLSSPGNLSVSLTAAWQGKSAEYYVSWRRSDAGNISNWQSQRVTEEQFEIKGVAENGQYDFQVYAVSVGGRKTDPISTTYKVSGTLSAPDAPTNLTAVGDYRSIVLNWVNPASVDLDHIEVLGSKSDDKDTAQLVAKVSGTTFTHNGLEDSVTWYYWARSVNKRGMYSGLNSVTSQSATTKDVLSFLQNKITSTELAQDLIAEIGGKADKTLVSDQVEQANNVILSTIDEVKSQTELDIDAAKKDVLSQTQSAIESVKDVASSGLASEAEARIQSIKDEANARSSAILNETNSRISDINTVRTLIQNDNESLAQQIAQVAAGTGEQFDPYKIWYFDDRTSDEWLGNASPTVTDDGWLRPANSSNAFLMSPPGLSVDGQAYKFIKARIKKVGNPAWLGEISWRSVDQSFTEANSTSIAEPEFDVTGTATLTVHDIPWSGITVDQIKLRLMTAQTDIDYLLFDWIAVGRPTPGAGMAALQQEQTARVEADAAEATQRNTLAVQLRGGYDGDDATQLTSGLLYSEQQLRVSADKAESEARQALATSLGTSVSNIEQSLETLNTAQQSQAGRLTSIESSLTVGDNLVPNPNYLNNAEGWVDVQKITEVNGYTAALIAGTAWTTNSPDMAVTEGDTLSWSFAIQAIDDLKSKDFAIYFLDADGKSVHSDWFYYQSLASGATDIIHFQGQVPKGAVRAHISSGAATGKFYLWNVICTRSSTQDLANAKAINDLTTTVSQQADTISSQSDSISKLNNNIGNKADSSALQALSSTVSQQGSSLSSQGVSINNLQNSLNNTDNNLAGKADASALQSLKNTVSTQGGDIATQGNEVSLLQASITAGSNIVPNPNFLGNAAGWDLTNFGTDSGRVYVEGNWQYSPNSTAFSVNPGDDLMIGGDFWLSQNGTITCRARFDGDSMYNNAAAVFDLTVSANTWTAGSGVVTVPYGASTCMVQVVHGTGTARLSKPYAFIKSASASAMNSLENKVTQQGEAITSQSNAITNLQNSLNSTNDSLGRKADSSALESLSNKVSLQNDALTAQSNRVNSLESSMTAGANLIPNPLMLNNAAGWGSSVQSVGTVDSLPAAVCSGSWMSYSGKFAVKPGETIYWSFDIQAIDDLANKDFSIYYIDVNGNQSSINDWFYYKDLAQGKRDHIEVSYVVPDNMSFAYLNGGRVSGKFYLWNVSATRQTGADKVNANAVSELSNIVSQHGGEISSQSNSISSLSNALAGKADSSALNDLSSKVTQQADNLQTQSNDIKSLQGKITSGDNLLPNPTFDNNGQGWDFSWIGASDYGLRIESSSLYSPSSSSFAVTPGDELSISGYLVSDTDQGVNLRIRFDGPNMSNNAWAVASSNMSSWAWQYFEGVATVPDGATTGMIQVVHGTGKCSIAMPVVRRNLATSKAMESLSSQTSQQGDQINSQAGRVSTLESTLTVADNLIPNPLFLNNAAGWGGAVKSTTTVDGYPAAVCSGTWMPYTKTFPVVTGDALDFSFEMQAIDSLKGKDFAIYFLDKNGASISSSWFYYKDLSAGSHDFANSSVTAPNGATGCYLSSGAVDGRFYLYNVKCIRASDRVKANASGLDSLSTRVSDIDGKVSAQTTQLQSIQSSVNASTSSIQTIQSTIASNSNLSSTWMVKMQIDQNGNKYAAGIGLGVDGNSLQSQFIVQADRFALMNTSDNNVSTPFVIEGGVTYMNAAMIKDASITSAKVGDLQSNNFVDGQTGWKIGKSGEASFTNISINGGSIKLKDSNGIVRVEMNSN